MKLIIDIPEEEVNECKRQVDMIKQEGFLIESLNTALKIHVANGTPLPKGLKKLIEVTPQPNIGHWIGIDEEPHEDYECNNCGYVVSTYTANIEPHTEYKYCPNCGAKMQEDEE